MCLAPAFISAHSTASIYHITRPGLKLQAGSGTCGSETKINEDGPWTWETCWDAGLAISADIVAITLDVMVNQTQESCRYSTSAQCDALYWCGTKSIMTRTAFNINAVPGCGPDCPAGGPTVADFDGYYFRGTVNYAQLSNGVGVWVGGGWNGPRPDFSLTRVGGECSQFFLCFPDDKSGLSVRGPGCFDASLSEDKMSFSVPTIIGTTRTWTNEGRGTACVWGSYKGRGQALVRGCFPVIKSCAAGKCVHSLEGGADDTATTRVCTTESATHTLSNGDYNPACCNLPRTSCDSCSCVPKGRPECCGHAELDQCPAGFTGVIGGLCTVCPAKTYKSMPGTAACDVCQANSNSPAGSTAASACTCNAGFTGVLGGACTPVVTDSPQ